MELHHHCNLGVQILITPTPAKLALVQPFVFMAASTMSTCVWRTSGAFCRQELHLSAQDTQVESSDTFSHQHTFWCSG